MTVGYEQRGQVAVLTIRRPEVHNCLNTTTLLQLREHIDRLAGDRAVRVVVVTGEGERAFCAGADLKERSTMSDEQVRFFIRTIRDTFSELERLPQPVIAAINGVAFGGGTELALACDLRVASDTARLGLTETSLGIIPGAGGTQRLPRLIGRAKAKELIFTARRISAAEALELGLVNRVVPPEQLMQTVSSLAEEIAANAPIALAQAKHAINCGMEVDLASGLAIESQAYQVLIPTRDRLEGLAAFREKRKPIYRGE